MFLELIFSFYLLCDFCVLLCVFVVNQVSIPCNQLPLPNIRGLRADCKSMYGSRVFGVKKIYPEYLARVFDPSI